MGEVRPLKAGESRANPDGTNSTELSITVTDPRLNSGRPTNIPSLWVVNGKMQELPEAEAVMKALEAGTQWPSFGSIEEAVTAAKTRSDAGGVAQGPLEDYLFGNSSGLADLRPKGKARGNGY